MRAPRSVCTIALASTIDLLVEANTFARNGVGGSDKLHDSYTEALGITYQYNTFAPLASGALGIDLKDRSARSVVRYNLIEGVKAEDFAEDLACAAGNELVSQDGKPEKFCAAHSSSALVVNSFGPFRNHPERLSWAGTVIAPSTRSPNRMQAARSARQVMAAPPSGSVVTAAWYRAAGAGQTKKSACSPACGLAAAPGAAANPQAGGCRRAARSGRSPNNRPPQSTPCS